MQHLLLLLIAFLLTSGCSDRKTQYDVISFFFTGIPSYEEYVNENNDKPAQEGAEKEDVAEPIKESLFAHPLWAEKKCDACHSISQETDSSDIDNIKLNKPVQQLCVSCHIDFKRRAAIKKRLFIHNPVASGQCLSCHEPHHSNYLYHLKYPLDKEICLPCHLENKEFKQTHSDIDTKNVKNSCLGCHSPHLGHDKALLRNKEGRK